jgi:hypothetical protein
MDFPTTLDVLLTRLCAVEARLAALEGSAADTVAVTVGRSDLDAALAKLGAAITLRDRRGRFNG